MEPTEYEGLSDEEIQRRLAGESVAGPRRFRGRELAAYTPGARDLVLKVLSPKDNAAFHDCVVCYILGELHALKDEDRLAKRRALIQATDDPDTFRAKLSIELMDQLSDAEIFEARQVVDSILAPVQAAQVKVVVPPGAKKKGDAKAASRGKATR